MHLDIITKNLSTFDLLNRKERLDILFHIASSSVDFKKLLSVLHNVNVRKFINNNEKHGFDITTARLGVDLSSRIKKVMLEHCSLQLSSHEYFILKMLASTKYLTTSEWEKLQKYLQYEPLQLLTKNGDNLKECQICSFPNENFICLSCKRNIKSFLEYRRDTFQIPINYINFNIRVKLNEHGEVLWHYKDWRITKHEGSKIINCELADLNPEYPSYEPNIPFVDYQRRIV